MTYKMQHIVKAIYLQISHNCIFRLPRAPYIQKPQRLLTNFRAMLLFKTAVFKCNYTVKNDAYDTV